MSIRLDDYESAFMAYVAELALKDEAFVKVLEEQIGTFGLTIVRRVAAKVDPGDD